MWVRSIWAGLSLQKDEIGLLKFAAVQVMMRFSTYK